MDPNLKVSCRDFAIFQLKLLINGMKDGMVFTVSFVADLVFKRHGQRRFFYRVLRLSERFDLWLNLHGAARFGRTVTVSVQVTGGRLRPVEGGQVNGMRETQ